MASTRAPIDPDIGFRDRQQMPLDQLTPPFRLPPLGIGQAGSIPRVAYPAGGKATSLLIDSQKHVATGVITT